MALPIITAFNAGEFSSSLDGRVDFAKYGHGCKRVENFLLRIQGPAQRRGGSRHLAAIKDQTKRTWGIRFEFSATQFFTLEFGDGYVRFITDHGQLVTGSVSAWLTSTAYVVGDLVVEAGTNYYCQVAHTSGTFATDLAAGKWYTLTDDIYEVPSPYALADLTTADGLCALRYEQSGDVLYIANAYGTIVAKKLTRHGNTNWIFTDYNPDQGPFLELNDTAITITSDAQTGNVTLTASSVLFAATDVGRLIRLESEDLEVKPWEVDKNYSTNDLTRFDGKTYKALNTKTSGTSPPIHTHGSAYDGKNGVRWEYQDAGYGVARITAFSSSISVDADVIISVPNGLNQLPADVVSTTTTRWNLGAWSATTSYPTAVAFWGPRLWWGGTPDVPRIWGTVPDDFENMAGDFFGEVRSDNAIWRKVPAKDVNDIVWMVGDIRLLLGTGGGEFVASHVTLSDPLGPANFQIVRQSKKRTRGVAPIAAGTSTAYVQRAGRKLLSMNFTIEFERYISSDLAVLAERVTRSGIVDITYQSEPYSIVWCVLADGALRAFTYDQAQDVTGWARHPLGGNFGGGLPVVEWCVAGPAPDGGRDELIVCVKRTINGSTARYIEYLEKPWEGDDEDGTAGDDQEDAFYVDSGLTYDGAATSSISGLDHLVGETVQILGDGAVQPDRVVDGSGAITLENAASVVHVGLQSVARLVPMRLDWPTREGTAQGRKKRINKAVVRFIDTLGGKAGKYGETLDSVSFRSPATPMGTAEPIRSGDVEVPFGGDYDLDGLLEIVQDQPLPMTVAAIMPRVDIADDD